MLHIPPQHFIDQLVGNIISGFYGPLLRFANFSSLLAVYDVGTSYLGMTIFHQDGFYDILKVFFLFKWIRMGRSGETFS